MEDFEILSNYGITQLDG